MTALLVLGGVVAVLLMAFMTKALLHPEDQ
jgi:hypothetical protein